MKAWVYIVAFVFFGPSASAQVSDSLVDTLSFRLLRQDDVVRIHHRNSLYKKLKDIRLGDRSHLSFGGSQRLQAEAFINEEFNRDLNQTDIWYLSRTMLHSHLKIRNRFELYGELSAGLITSKANLVPVDKDQLSVTQLFAEYHPSKDWTVFAGRYNMRLGSGRLVDIREGPNVRISFDMAGFEWDHYGYKVKVFYGVPVRPQEGIFDNDVLNFTEQLAAVYTTFSWRKSFKSDFYAMYKLENDKQWNAGTANDERISLGTRLFGALKGVDYNSEFVYQFGFFGNTPIRAWTASFDLTKEWKKKWAVGLKTEAISGNNGSQATSFNTFDGLYPRGAYFGRVARFGPSNLIDAHPYTEIYLGKFQLDFDYVAFWRFSVDDGLYNPALILGYPALNQERFIGNQIGTVLSYGMNNFITLEVESNVIFPGAFLISSGLDDPLVHFVATAEFKF